MSSSKLSFHSWVVVDNVHRTHSAGWAVSRQNFEGALSCLLVTPMPTLEGTFASSWSMEKTGVQCTFLILCISTFLYECYVAGRAIPSFKKRASYILDLLLLLGHHRLHHQQKWSCLQTPAQDIPRERYL